MERIEDLSPSQFDAKRGMQFSTVNTSKVAVVVSNEQKSGYYVEFNNYQEYLDFKINKISY